MSAASCWARAAPLLLVHVNLLLAAFGGAALATGARLKWDPTTYVVLREVAPAEYRALAALVPAAGLAALLLAHLALAALAHPPQQPARRAMLLIYAVCTALMVVGEVWAVAWAWRQAAEWARRVDHTELQALLALRDHLLALLATLARWHPLPNTIKDIIQEVEADGPRNGYVAGACGALVLVLQAAGVLLALLSLRRAPATATAPAPSRRAPITRRLLTLSER